MGGVLSDAVEALGGVWASTVARRLLSSWCLGALPAWVSRFVRVASTTSRSGGPGRGCSSLSPGSALNWRQGVWAGCSAGREVVGVGHPSPLSREASRGERPPLRLASLLKMTVAGGTKKRIGRSQPRVLAQIASRVLAPDETAAIIGGHLEATARTRTRRQFVSGFASRVASGRMPSQVRPTWRARIWCAHVAGRFVATPASTARAFP